MRSPRTTSSLYGRAAISEDDDELGRQLGDGAMKSLKKAKIAPTDALAEVAEATEGGAARRACLRSHRTS